MLQSIHDYKSFCWASKWVRAALVLGGDQPFIRRLIGVSTSTQVGTIYNMGMWDKAAAVCLRVDVRRTLDNEAAARHQYQVTGLSLDNGGCVAEPHIVVDRCWVFLCILHCCMAIGRLHVAFVEARLESLPKENAEAVQRLLYRARTGVKLGANAAPDGEEARALLLASEEMGPLLAYAPEVPEWQAVVAMRDLLRDLDCDKPPLNDLGACAVARQYRAHCCKVAYQCIYLLYVEEDVTTAVANAARLGLGLAAVCADVVESLNAILKQACNDLKPRGGGGMPEAASLEREAEVVLQVWEWWFLKFDLPLRTQRTPMWPHVQWPHSCLTIAPHPCPFPLPPQFLLVPSMDPATMEALIEKMFQKMRDKVVCAWPVCMFVCL